MSKFRSKSTSTVVAAVRIGDEIITGSASSSSTATGDFEAESSINASSISTDLAQSDAYKTVQPQLTGTTTVSYVANTTTITNTVYPWTRGNTQINGFFMWQGNFEYNQTTSAAYYFRAVSKKQTSYLDPLNGALVQGSGTFIYSDEVPTDANVNCVILFNGYSNAATALNSTSLTNYTTGKNMYTLANNYLKSLPTGTPSLLCLSLGGGNSAGGWNTGTLGAIYSIYQAVTPINKPFSYVETGTGNNVTLSGKGTGILNPTSYNSLFFDIETWYNTGGGGTSDYGSSGKDFLNLFNYIKHSITSTFNGYECIIIVSMAHSCSNFNGTGQSVLSTIYSDNTGSYDYLSPQMYTQNIGSINEYAANYNILWNDSYKDANNSINYYLTNHNVNYSKYGVNMFLPSINLPNLYIEGGTNNAGFPNLYWYQYNGNTVPPSLAAASGVGTIEYYRDYGVGPFFNSIMNGTSGKSQTTGTIGGYIQWVNGTLITN